MGSLLVRNGLVATMVDNQPKVQRVDLFVEGRIIRTIAPDIDTETDRVIDARDALITPGLINAHTHAAMTLLRSFADDLPLHVWLQEKIWPAEHLLTSEDFYCGTLLACAEMIRAGVTCFADMYNATGSVVQAVVEAGMRASLSEGIIGLGSDAAEQLAIGRAVIREYQGAGAGRVTVCLAPHALYTCPPPFMARVIEVAAAEDARIHIHILETRKEMIEAQATYGKTVTEVLEELRLFELPVLAAHCVHLSERDLQILSRPNVTVVHNPGSNLKLGSGIAPIPALLQHGACVALGTDGASSNNNLDLLEEARLTALIHKGVHEAPEMIDAYQALRMATQNGARAVGLEASLGTLAPGMLADLVIWDARKPHLVPQFDPIANLIYSAQASDARTVIIDGRVVMENRVLQTIDEEQVMFDALRCVEKLS